MRNPRTRLPTSWKKSPSRWSPGSRRRSLASSAPFLTQHVAVTFFQFARDRRHVPMIHYFVAGALGHCGGLFGPIKNGEDLARELLRIVRQRTEFSIRACQAFRADACRYDRNAAGKGLKQLHAHAGTAA